MNWSFLVTESLLPLMVALGIALGVGVVVAIRLNRKGGSSRAALAHLLRSMMLTFSASFLLFALWQAWGSLRILAGSALDQPADQRAMGLLRARGEGCLRRDPAKAAFWFQRAAVKGDAEAQLLLAQALLQGRGLRRDPAGALQWAQSAGNQGQPYAMLLAGDLLLPGDAHAAQAWYSRALAAFRQRIQAGDADACLDYGLMIREGKGIERDPVEGLAWMLVAADRGLHPVRAFAVRMTAARAAPALQADATRRAEAIRKSLVTGNQG
jgi:TPR repeat protein